jgi:hypothetical protein
MFDCFKYKIKSIIDNTTPTFVGFFVCGMLGRFGDG